MNVTFCYLIKTFKLTTPVSRSSCLIRTDFPSFRLFVWFAFFEKSLTTPFVIGFEEVLLSISSSSFCSSYSSILPAFSISFWNSMPLLESSSNVPSSFTIPSWTRTILSTCERKCSWFVTRTLVFPLSSPLMHLSKTWWVLAVQIRTV